MMYATLLFFHTSFRWLVLASLLFALYRAGTGCLQDRAFSRIDEAARRWTVTIAHIQLVLGMLLYTQSPAVRFYWKHGAGSGYPDGSFFALVHAAAMLTAIAVLTAGAAKAKRTAPSGARFRILLRWYTAALILILLAIPWPFSPLSQRPYFR